MSVSPPSFDLYPIIRVMSFGPNGGVDRVVTNVDDLRALMKEPTRGVLWVDLDGFGAETGNLDQLNEIGLMFGVHPLALEDVIHTHQRAKAEPYDDRLFLVAHKYSIQEQKPLIEQVSLFLGPDFVLSFQEHPWDCFEPAREKLRRRSGSKAVLRADQIAYHLLDTVVDSAFPVLEFLGNQLDDLEDTLIDNPAREVITAVHDLRRSLQSMRRQVWPLRDALSQIQNLDDDLIKPDLEPFFRDCSDHTLQILDILETYRERASGLTDLYMSMMSHKMNEVMKVLTVIATIFMPLTFIVGVYGMNFDPLKSPYNMPEIEWRYGYIYVWILMMAIAVGMISYFRKRGWFD